MDNFKVENPFSLPVAQAPMVFEETSRPDRYPPEEAAERSERAKEERFFHPTEDDVYHNLAGFLDESKETGKPTVKLERGKLIAFRCDDFTKNDWKRVNPVDAWKDKGNDFHLCFAIECDDSPTPERVLGSLPYQIEERHRGIDPKHFLLMITSESKALGRSFDDEEKKKGFRLHRAGIAKAGIGRVLGACFEDSTLQLNPRENRWDEESITLREETISGGGFYDVESYDQSYEKGTRETMIRMAMMEIGGNRLPRWYKDRLMIRETYRIQSKELLRLVDESGLLTSVDNEKPLGELIAEEIDRKPLNSPSLDRDTWFRWMPDRPETKIQFGGSIMGPLRIDTDSVPLGALLPDPDGFISLGLKRSDGVVSGAFQLRLATESVNGGDETTTPRAVRLMGVEITNNATPDVAMMLWAKQSSKRYSPGDLEATMFTSGIMEEVKIDAIGTVSKREIPDPVLTRGKT